MRTIRSIFSFSMPPHSTLWPFLDLFHVYNAKIILFIAQFRIHRLSSLSFLSSFYIHKYYFPSFISFFWHLNMRGIVCTLALCLMLASLSSFRTQMQKKQNFTAFLLFNTKNSMRESKRVSVEYYFISPDTPRARYTQKKNIVS